MSPGLLKSLASLCGTMYWEKAVSSSFILLLMAQCLFRILPALPRVVVIEMHRTGQDAYYGVTGRFPTLFATTNGNLSRLGLHALNTGGEMLGLNVSAEINATDTADPDDFPNLADSDRDERIFVIIEGEKAKLAFAVTVAQNVPKLERYVNGLLDFDHSGNWSKGNLGDGSASTIRSMYSQGHLRP